MAALLREAKAQGKELPPGFSADDLENLHREEFWAEVLCYAVHSARQRTDARKIWGGRRFFWFQMMPKTLPARLCMWMAGWSCAESGS